MTSRPQLLALLGAGALVGALVIAYATQGADDPEGGPYAAAVEEAIPKVEASVGLPFKERPRFELRSRDEVRQYVERRLDDSLGREQTAGQEAALKRLGLIPDTMSLRALLADLLEEQISGVYDPPTNTLYVVEGAEDETLALTVTHELVHALQDQYLDLDSALNVRGDDDRQLALQSVMEGQATFEHMRIMFGADMPAIPGGWDRLREEIRNQRMKWPVLANSPLVIQETLVFPYLSGAEFMRAVRESDPQAMPLTDLPTSSEQIMHPSRYLGTRDAPTPVPLPPLRGMTTVYENTLGEFTVRLFLFEHLRDQQGAIAGAAGWDGDRYAVVRTSRGEGIVWLSVWDSLTDGGEFFTLLDRTIDRRYGPSTARTLSPPQAGPGMTSTRRYEVAGRSIAISTGEIGGRIAVLYVDLATGDDPMAFDASRLRFED